MKFAKTALFALGLLVLSSASAMAQGTTAPAPLYPFWNLHGIGVGLVIIGAAIGIGGLTKSAVESIARQPEMAANIQTAMIISAALIEGVTFFALILVGFVIKVS
jgi:F-type H+-transporting ATPase subunit c